MNEIVEALNEISHNLEGINCGLFCLFVIIGVIGIIEFVRMLNG